MNQEFWNDYYSHWDKFVKDWFEKVKDLHIDFSNVGPIQAYEGVRGLDLKELPEPYVRKVAKDGLNYNHGRVKAIMINLNPGASSFAESTKCIKCLNEKGALIERYANECNGDYSAWISKYGGLLNEYPHKMCKRSIPGVDWWQGRNGIGGRMRWIRSFYGNDVTPEDVFALEFCPYHSKSWAFGRMPDETKSYVLQHVIKPAVVAATEDDVSCIACIGKDLEKIFEEILEFRRTASWEKGAYIENGRCEDINGWPTTGPRNNPVDMHYVLYQGECEGLPIRPFLSIWHKGGNKPPAERFCRVEAAIRERINKLCC